jgi:ubiquinone/menaquinone biosynthesis C-methylase UbiE
MNVVPEHSEPLLRALYPFLLEGSGVSIIDGLPAAPIVLSTAGMKANAHYFSQLQWVDEWYEHVHRSPKLRARWHAVAGTWDEKVVVDVGCGPGNLFQNIGGRPAALIGIDIARGSLERAGTHGYLPLMADAHAMPLRSECADVVALNATIHHCDDMRKVIAESGRLVKPGGVLVADHDPQLSAYNLCGLGKLIWNSRTLVYRLINRAGHRAEGGEQEWAAATEIHHDPGDGVTAELFRSALDEAAFEMTFYPHNQEVGEEIVSGQMGRSPRKMRFAQRLSGIDPSSRAAGLSLMCVARRKV